MKKSEPDKKKLLEEIRRQAEEAELKRIEEEERERRGIGGAKPPTAATKSRPSPPRPAPVPAKPPSVKAEPPSVARPGPVTGKPPSVTAKPPAAAVKPPSVTAKPPTAVVKPPSVTATPPTAEVRPPSATTKPPSARVQQPAPSTTQQEMPPRVPASEVPVERPRPFPEPPPSPGPAPFPAPHVEVPTSPSTAAKEQRVMVLRERLQIALDRGKLEKATQLLADLEVLVPDDRGLAEVRANVKSMQTKKVRGKDKAPVEAAPKEHPATDRVQRDAQRKRIAELIETANSLYQQEKYERGLQVIEEILALEPGNEETIRLRDQIKKAQELALRIQEEDTRRRAEEGPAAAPAPVVLPEQQPRRDQDVWGTSTIPRADVSYELPPEQKGPAGPPRQPLVYRLAEQLSEVRIPVKPLVYSGIAVVVLIVGYLIVESLATSVTPPRDSLLVLPPTTIAVDTSSVSVADGFAEDVMSDLAAIGDLRVIAPVTAFGLKSSSLSKPQIARSLGANYYLQWSILRTPDGVEIQPAMYDTLSSQPKWVSRYQTSKNELPALRNEFVHRIAAAMQIGLSDEEETALRKTPTANGAAYDLYLRGRLLMRRPEGAALDEAIRTLQLSIVADSAFADAHAALGWAHILAYESETVPVPSHIAEASRCVERAVVLGSRSSELLRVWGMLDAYRAQFQRAVQRLGQAVKMSPSDAESQRRLAVWSVVRGQHDAALRAAERAASDDPGNVDSYTTLGMIEQARGDYRAAFQYYELGLRLARDRSAYASGFYADMLVYLKRYDAAVDVLTDRIARTKENDLDIYKLGRIAQSAGRPKPEVQASFLRAKSILTARIAANPDDASSYSSLALVNTRLGEFRDAVAANARAQQLAPNDIGVLYNTARMYAIQMDKAKALEYLSKAINERYSLPDILDMDFHNLRTEQDFISTVTR